MLKFCAVKSNFETKGIFYSMICSVYFDLFVLIKSKNPPLGSKFLPFRADLFSRLEANFSNRVATPESVYKWTVKTSHIMTRNGLGNKKKKKNK